ncbi:vacuolar protein sorting-associated protein 35 [Hyaloraphidium curvatum]|nr:vacuolar protein sorting-associated protein 35 [Hyaloraphidium curvatum]
MNNIIGTVASSFGGGAKPSGGALAADAPASPAHLGGEAADQGKALEEAMQVVKVQAYHMKKCLDGNRLMDALKHCSTMLAELRTSSLTPKYYYELYMAIFDELRHLTTYLYESHVARRHHLSDLYELVQYAGNIVPRLYLMITVGSVYMRVSKQAGPGSAAPAAPAAPAAEGAPAGENGDADKWEEDVPPIKELMRDMLEMSRGVQHPTRGLFLRQYLSQMTRDYLPEGTVDGPHGTLLDSLHFTLQNFVEMNKLWVRLQYQGPSKEREKREQERKELRQLVGSNLVRLSQLDEVDLEVYKATILPAILEEIVSCRDVIAQEYLMEVIIQVFHDDLHLRTLDQFLSATAQLQRQVNVKQIVISLVDRFAAYAARSREEEEARRKEVLKSAQTEGPEAVAKLQEEFAEKPLTGVPDDVKLFDVFWTQIAELVKQRPEFTIADVVALLRSLLDLSLNTYPEKVDNVDKVVGLCKVAVANAVAARSPELAAPGTINLLLQLLMAPVNAYGSNLMIFLEFPSSATQAPAEEEEPADEQAEATSPRSQSLAGHYTDLLNLQPYATRRTIAHTVADKLIHYQTPIASTVQVQLVLGELCNVMVRDQKDGGLFGEASTEGRLPEPGKGKLDWEDVGVEQGKVARLVHLVRFVPGEGEEAGGREALDEEFLLLSAARQYFGTGGDLRLRYTVPALVDAAVKLARKYKMLVADGEAAVAADSLEALYRWLHQTIRSFNTTKESLDDAGTKLAQGLMSPHDMALRLAMQAAQASDILPAGIPVEDEGARAETGNEEMTYEFVSEALSIFENTIPDSRKAFEALTIIIQILRTLFVLSAENYTVLAQRCTTHAARLLRRLDQCKGLSLASLLYWEHPSLDPKEAGKRCVEVLQKAEAHAAIMLDPAAKAEALVDILDRYLWFFSKGNEAVFPHTIANLVASISSILSQLSSLPTSALTAAPGPLTGSVFGDNVMGAAAPGGVVGTGKVRDEALRAFGNSVAHVRMRIEESRRTGTGRWRDIEIPGPEQ